MNEAHKACGGDEWLAIIRDHVLPSAIAGLDLGDDVLAPGRRSPWPNA